MVQRWYESVVFKRISGHSGLRKGISRIFKAFVIRHTNWHGKVCAYFYFQAKQPLLYDHCNERACVYIYHTLSYLLSKTAVLTCTADCKTLVEVCISRSYSTAGLVCWKSQNVYKVEKKKGRKRESLPISSARTKVNQRKKNSQMHAAQSQKWRAWRQNHAFCCSHYCCVFGIDHITLMLWSASELGISVVTVARAHIAGVLP